MYLGHLAWIRAVQRGCDIQRGPRLGQVPDGQAALRARSALEAPSLQRKQTLRPPARRCAPQPLRVLSSVLRVAALLATSQLKTSLLGSYSRAALFRMHSSSCFRLHGWVTVPFSPYRPQRPLGPWGTPVHLAAVPNTGQGILPQLLLHFYVEGDELFCLVGEGLAGSRCMHAGESDRPPGLAPAFKHIVGCTTLEVG